MATVTFDRSGAQSATGGGLWFCNLVIAPASVVSTATTLLTGRPGAPVATGLVCRR